MFTLFCFVKKKTFNVFFYLFSLIYTQAQIKVYICFCMFVCIPRHVPCSFILAIYIYTHTYIYFCASISILYYLPFTFNFYFRKYFSCAMAKCPYITLTTVCIPDESLLTGSCQICGCYVILSNDISHKYRTLKDIILCSNFYDKLLFSEYYELVKAKNMQFLIHSFRIDVLPIIIKKKNKYYLHRN